MQNIDNKNIDKEVHLCLSFSNAGAYITKESKNKFLIFVLTENNKEVLELNKKLWNEIKKQMKTINSGESIKYKNDIMKIILNPPDNVPLNKILPFFVLNILC